MGNTSNCFFRQTIKNPRCIGSGKDGLVYKVSSGKVAKVWNNPNKSRLFHEYEVAKELYDAGVNVPAPYGIYPIEIVNQLGEVEIREGFVMDFIQTRGTALRNWREYWPDTLEEKQARTHLRKQYAKLKTTGYKNTDTGPGNWLWDGKELWLIDFAWYEKRRGNGSN